MLYVKTTVEVFKQKMSEINSSSPAFNPEIISEGGDGIRLRFRDPRIRDYGVDLAFNPIDFGRDIHRVYGIIEFILMKFNAPLHMGTIIYIPEIGYHDVVRCKSEDEAVAEMESIAEKLIRYLSR